MSDFFNKTFKRLKVFRRGAHGGRSGNSKFSGSAKINSNQAPSLQGPSRLEEAVNGSGPGPGRVLERSNTGNATTLVDEELPKIVPHSGIADVFDLHKSDGRYGRSIVPQKAPLGVVGVDAVYRVAQDQSLARAGNGNSQVGGGGLVGEGEVGVEVIAPTLGFREGVPVNAFATVSGPVHDGDVRAAGRADERFVEGRTLAPPVSNNVTYMVDEFLNNNLDDLGIAGPQGRREMFLNPGAFHQAHDITMNYPLFLDVSKSSTKAMKLLFRKAIPNSSLNSSTQFSQPACLKGTREGARNRILDWLVDMNRKSNLLWLYGAAGAGTTTVAQDIAKRCKDYGRLGAAFFFSRSNHEEPDPARIIPSVAYQLATTYSAYKQRVACLLDQDPSILEEAIYGQFDKLIVQPLSGLVTEKTHSILILIDGLDNCRDSRVQETLIELIGGFAALANHSKLPFVWIIASRREWQIFRALEMADPPIQFIQEELRIDTAEAQQDVTRFLRHGFKKVRGKYVDSFAIGSTWPTEDQFLTLKTQSDGLFAFAAALLVSVEGDDPVANLKDCLNYLTRGIVPRSGNPLRSVYDTYQGILDTVPPEILPVTKRILSFLVLGAREIPARAVEEFLSLEQSTFYGSLRRLHSVLGIPSPQISRTAPLYVIHASFGKFLRPFVSSGEFDLDVRIRGTHDIGIIEDRCMVSYDLWRVGGLYEILPAVLYYSDPDRNIMRFLMGELWAIWANKDEREMHALCCGILRRFDFSEYDHVDGKLEALSPVREVGRHITAFLILLSSWQDENASTGDDYPILRSEPRCTKDNLLLNEYEDIVHHPRISKFDPSRLKHASGQWSYQGFSQVARRPALPHCPKMADVVARGRPMFFLLGHDVNTCLMVGYQLGQ
ncbi:hypothetical protein P691DRAFT_766712 [Macrolepiota fuliginosa MF-IS2]|uniref:Nephrocystin 3-like N-terminal domain-containing protein n=1 Tax=Macrolepiota fuliginosa MF-IS2 TaxID=1400762 RepID=A0A9P5X1E0_9AGAR|nr:hypothetical protein P691DRAFT_766712 [Macrolepiota fuliginosa MF-IS2]